MSDEQGTPVNSLIDKRHTMFANDIKRHINEQNAHNAKGKQHQLTTSNGKSSTIKIASVPLQTTAAPETAVQRPSIHGADI